MTGGTAAPRRVRIGVLALQGDVREHLRMLAEVGAEPVAVRRPSELAGLEGLIVPGGESTTMGKLAMTAGLLEPLRAAVRGGLPVYGSCAGMVLLADRVLDGAGGTAVQPLVGGLDVAVRRNAFGRQVDSFEAEIAFDGLEGGPLEAVFIRAPWVETVGEGAAVLGTVIDVHSGAARVVAVRQGDLLATAFHPELTGDSRVHALFVRMVREHAARARPPEPAGVSGRAADRSGRDGEEMR